MRPMPPRSLREEYEAAGLAGTAGTASVTAGTGGGRLAGAARSRASGDSSGSGTLVGGGLVITDQAAPRSLETEAAEQLAALQAARGVQAQAGAASAASSSTRSGGDDPFAMLLGTASSGWELGDGPGEAKASKAEEAGEARQRRRRQRRKDWWWRRGGRGDEAALP